MAKKYYFFKLKDDFFNTLEVKKLRKLAGGDTLTIIYLEMILESLKYDGKLYYEGVDETFESEMALKLNENVENVSLALAYLLKHGLIEKGIDETYTLTQVESNILGETSSAERVRKYRAKQKALQCNTNVTSKKLHVLPSNKSVNGDIEIDIDKEIDIELDKERENEETGNSGKDNKNVYRCFEECGFGTLNRMLIEMIDTDIEQYTCKWVIEAMKETVRQGKYKYSYVEGILRNWKTDGKEKKHGATKQDKNSTTDSNRAGIGIEL